jgi:hypothetical protein
VIREREKSSSNQVESPREARGRLGLGMWVLVGWIFLWGGGVYPSVARESVCKKLKLKEINGIPLEHDEEYSSASD